jgi:uncharacterized protein (TIGR00251 family)
VEPWKRSEGSKKVGFMMITIKASPNAKKPVIKKINETLYEVRIDAPPDKGKANVRLIELLADYLKLSKSSIRIVRGHKGRNKIVEIKFL